MRNTREILRQKWLLRRLAPRDRRVGRRERRGGEPRAGARARRGAHMGGGARRSTDAELEARLYPSVVRGGGAAGARLHVDSPRATSRRRDAGAAASRVPGAASGRPSVHDVLRSLPRVAGPSRARDAAGARRGRQGLRRLLGEEGRGSSTRRRARSSRSSSSSRRSARRTSPTRRRRTRSAAPIGSRATCAPSSTSAACRRRCVPDQLKSGVTRACRYEPEVQRTYEELAQHYGTTVLPARPLHPRDKAKVEVAVQIAQRWLLARIRNEVFHSLGALNARLRELLVDLNGREMRRYGKSRRALFEADRARGAASVAGDALRVRRLAEGAREHRLPRAGRRAPVLGAVPARARGGRGAAQRRRRRDPARSGARRVAPSVDRVKGGFTTITEHMPSAHRAHAEWTPSRILTWAARSATATRELCEAILADRPHPEQGFRSCLGILRLGKRYGDVRLEAACSRALRRARTLVSPRRIDPEERTRSRRRRPTSSTSLPLTHENVRGRDYYH